MHNEKKVRIDSVKIIKRYHGLVLGLARIKGLQFLVCLSAFDPTENTNDIYLPLFQANRHADKDWRKPIFKRFILQRSKFLKKGVATRRGFDIFNAPFRLQVRTDSMIANR